MVKRLKENYKNSNINLELELPIGNRAKYSKIQEFGKGKNTEVYLQFFVQIKEWFGGIRYLSLENVYSNDGGIAICKDENKMIEIKKRSKDYKFYLIDGVYLNTTLNNNTKVDIIEKVCNHLGINAFIG
jgi:hypothetical protein